MRPGHHLFRPLGLALVLGCFGCVGGANRLAKLQPHNPPAPSVAPARVAPPLMIPGPSPAAAALEVPTSAAPAAAAVVQAAPSQPTVPAAPPQAAPDPTAQLRTLYRRAAERYAGLDGYVVRMRRREQINGKNHPEEEMLFKFRKQPWSIYLKFVGKEGKGREVVYVKGQHQGKIHTLTAAGDIPLMPGGQHIALAPDNSLVRAASRYPITEAGIGVLIERFGRLLEGVEQGSQTGARPPDLGPPRLQYRGLQQRPEFAEPLHTVAEAIPAHCEPALPKGGQRFWFFDPGTHLPGLIITQDQAGREVEYYCYDQFQAPVRLTDADFNPARLWPARP